MKQGENSNLYDHNEHHCDHNGAFNSSMCWACASRMPHELLITLCLYPQASVDAMITMMHIPKA